MKINKKGNLVTDNAVGLILAAAAIFLLVYLLVALFNSGYDNEREIAESYLNSFENALSEADSVGKSSFFILDFGKEDLDYYLVNFGEAFNFERDERSFVRSPKSGAFCICYWQGERIICGECLDVENFASYRDVERYKVAPWMIREGEGIIIIEGDVGYEFIKS